MLIDNLLILSSIWKQINLITDKFAFLHVSKMHLVKYSLNTVLKINMVK